MTTPAGGGGSGWQRRVGLVCAVVGLLLLLGTLALVFVDGGLDQQTALLLFAGVALVAAFPILDPGAVSELVAGQRSRRASLSAFVGAAGAGILIALDVVAAGSTAAADLTNSGLYTLSPRSVQAIRHLESDLVVTGFFRPEEQTARRSVRALLDLYREQSPRVKVRFVDPDQDQVLALRLGARVAGSIVLQYRARPPVVLDQARQTESDVTGAIARLESARTPVVCWAGGDGERDLRDSDEVTGYSAVADLLRRSSYRLRDVLPTQQGVPAACEVLVVLQLGRGLDGAEVAAIQGYLARGGRLLLAVDPWLDPRIVASANAVLQPYGAAFDGGLVIEPDPAHAATNDSTVPVVNSFGASSITKDLDRRYVFFPASTPIVGAGAAAAVSTDLAVTTDRAYVIRQERTDLSRRATDRPGPFVLMRSIEQARAGPGTRGPGATTRIVLAGTSALAENRTLAPSTSSSNSDLLLASLDWLSQQDSLISIAPRPPRAVPLSLTERDARLNVVLALPLPVLLVLAAGMIVRARRRL